MDTRGLDVYIIGIVFSSVFLLLSQYNKNRFEITRINIFNKKGLVFLALSCVVLWGIAAFRGEVGIDYYNYEEQYLKTKDFQDIVSYYEPLFGLINFLCFKLFDSFQAVLIITAFSTGACLWYAMYRDCKSLIIAFFCILGVNLYFMSFSVIRQFLAIGILMLSIPYIQKRDFRHFLPIYLVASLIHYTAVIYVLIYLLYDNSTKTLHHIVKYLLLFVIFIFVFFYLDSLVGYLMAGAVFLRDTYSTIEVSGDERPIFQMIVLLPVAFVILFYRKRLISLNPNNGVYILMFLFLILCKFIGLKYLFLSRIHYYFSFSIPVILSNLPKVTAKWLSAVMWILAMSYAFYGLISIFEYQWEDFLPYSSIF